MPSVEGSPTVRVDRTCALCGIDRGSLVQINGTKGQPLGLYCGVCAVVLNGARHRGQSERKVA